MTKQEFKKQYSEYRLKLRQSLVTFESFEKVINSNSFFRSITIHDELPVSMKIWAYLNSK